MSEAHIADQPDDNTTLPRQCALARTYLRRWVEMARLQGIQSILVEDTEKLLGNDIHIVVRLAKVRNAIDALYAELNDPNTMHAMEEAEMSQVRQNLSHYLKEFRVLLIDAMIAQNKIHGGLGNTVMCG